jgi:hypothetical protein
MGPLLRILVTLMRLCERSVDVLSPVCHRKTTDFDRSNGNLIESKSDSPKVSVTIGNSNLIKGDPTQDDAD